MYVERNGAVEAGGRVHKVVIHNLSSGGAMIVGGLPELAVATPAVLTVDGIKPSLSGVIARSDQGGTLITFKITEATETLVEDLVNGGQRAA